MTNLRFKLNIHWKGVWFGFNECFTLSLLDLLLVYLLYKEEKTIWECWGLFLNGLVSFLNQALTHMSLSTTGLATLLGSLISFHLMIDLSDKKSENVEVLSSMLCFPAQAFTHMSLHRPPLHRDVPNWWQPQVEPQLGQNFQWTYNYTWPYLCAFQVCVFCWIVLIMMNLSDL